MTTSGPSPRNAEFRPTTGRGPSYADGHLKAGVYHGRLAALESRHRHGLLTPSEEQEWRGLIAKEGFVDEAAREGLHHLALLSLGIMAADILLGEVEA